MKRSMAVCVEPAMPRSMSARLTPHALMEQMRTAEAAARLGAQALARDGHCAREVRSSVGKDIKIGADFALDRLIGEHLRRNSPFPVVSEETADDGVLAAHQCRWIVDPLDGSFNLHRGIPFACVSIALWRGLEPLVGVIQDVGRDERFSGVLGKGAWLNGVPICVGDVRHREHAVLCSGFPVGGHFSSERVSVLIDDVRCYKKIRMLGSAALSLAYVACGRADVYAEEGIALWDVAAGLAIVRAAGGVVQMAPSVGGWTLTVLAGNRFLVERQAAGRSARGVGR